MTKEMKRSTEKDETDRREAAPQDSELVQKVPIKDIETHTSGRSIDSHAVGALAGSFSVAGQINPIIISRAPDGRFTVVAGNHRLAAARKLGWREIHARIVELDDVDREILQIDENLIRKELTELETAEQLHRRKELFDQKGGEKISTPGGEQKIGFDQATGAKVGRSKSTIQKARKRAEKITLKVRDKIRGTPAADKGTELDALAAMSPTNQWRAANLYANQKVKTIREARTQINAKPERYQSTFADGMLRMPCSYTPGGV